MKVSYDSKYDIVYIKFVEGPREVTTRHIDEDIALDFDAEKRLVGIEILSASKYLDWESLLPVVYERETT